MRFLVVLFIAMSVPVPAKTSKIQKPAISVKVVPPAAVPKGSCKPGEAEVGYLDTGDGHNHWTPYPPAELGSFIAEHAKLGFIVTVYPQPNGRWWADATCGVQAN